MYTYIHVHIYPIYTKLSREEEMRYTECDDHVLLKEVVEEVCGAVRQLVTREVLEKRHRPRTGGAGNTFVSARYEHFVA